MKAKCCKNSRLGGKSTRMKLMRNKDYRLTLVLYAGMTSCFGVPEVESSWEGGTWVGTAEKRNAIMCSVTMIANGYR